MLNHKLIKLILLDRNNWFIRNCKLTTYIANYKFVINTDNNHSYIYKYCNRKQNYSLLSSHVLNTGLAKPRYLLLEEFTKFVITSIR